MNELLEQALTNVVSSAPGVAVLAALLWRQIRELRARDELHDARLASIERKTERLCESAGREVTGRHSVLPEPPRRGLPHVVPPMPRVPDDDEGPPTRPERKPPYR